ncbi:MAG: DUF2207 domain-containing protein, partial [Flavobacterium sp.]
MNIKISKLVLLVLFLYQFSWSQNEKIINFDTQILVKTDRNIVITEKIKVFANGDEIKRGITRNIPLDRIDFNNKVLRFKVNIISIKHNGVKCNYIDESRYDELYIKIGDKDVFIDTGIHEYEIKYSVYGQIGFYKNYDEIYWNTTGNHWNFPIEYATATVILPKGAKAIQSIGYTGTQGSKSIISKNLKLTFTAQNLQAKEGLTVAVGFEKGFVAPPPPPPPPPPPTFFEKYGIIILAFFGLILLMIYYINTWRKHGIDPPKPIVYPQFSAPENMSPASMAMIYKEMYWDDLVSFSIVNLAVKGYLQIKDTSNKIFGIFKNNSFELIKLKNSDSSLPLEEQTLINKLFSTSNVLVIDGSYNSEIKNAISNHKADLEFKNRNLINEGNHSKFLILPIVFFILFFGISIFFHTEDTTTALFHWCFALFGVIVISSLIFLFSKLLKFKFTFGSVFRLFLLIIGLVFAGVLSFYHHDYTLNQLVVGYFVSFAFISYSYYVFLIKRPSEEKLHKQSLIEGFKMYINAAETQQLQFHNPPEMTPQHFESILPYAMALGVEEIWGEKFKKSISKIIQNSEYQQT